MIDMIMTTLRDFLEKINIRGEIAFDEPMAAHTTFRIGGPADALVAPADREELLRLIAAARAAAIPCFILGGGANVVFGDRGMRGIVVDTRHIDGVEEVRPMAGQSECDASLAEGDASEGKGDALLVAGAGLSMDGLCEAALARGLAGVETFYGMPGTVGGAVFMNARCYEVEVADRLAWAELATDDGLSIESRPHVADEWSYKRSPFQPGGAAAGAIVLGAAFRLRRGDKKAIEAVMREKRADREAKGHYRLPSAGSVFKNDRRLGQPSGKILDSLGLRGRRIGGAMVSEWHANIFVNAGGAKAAELRALVELARDEARERLGVELEPEVLFVGDF
jgi:UDP-N-acetylmuramate dehydrogenase